MFLTFNSLSAKYYLWGEPKFNDIYSVSITLPIQQFSHYISQLPSDKMLMIDNKVVEQGLATNQFIVHLSHHTIWQTDYKLVCSQTLSKVV